jgi:Tfp pilus assembly protein PilE
MRPVGFTVLELVISLVLAGLLLTITMRSLASLEPRYAVAQARNALTGLHAQARDRAGEARTAVRRDGDTRSDSAWITRGDMTLDVVRFAAEHGVDLPASRPFDSLCMSSRGYADAACTSFDGSVSLALRRGPDLARTVLGCRGRLETVDAP